MKMIRLVSEEVQTLVTFLENLFWKCDLSGINNSNPVIWKSK